MPKYPYRDLGTSLGRDFRNNLNANFDDIESDIREANDRLDDIDSRIDNIVADAGQSNTEIVDARNDSVNNVTYPTLKDRLDTHANEIGILSNYGVNVESYPRLAGETDDTERIKRAIAAAGDDGRVIVPPRTYYISGKITIPCHFDARGAEFIVTANIPVAVEIRTGAGTTLFRNKTVYLPKITKQTKTWDGTDVGVEVANAYESNIYVSRVTNFSKGLKVSAYGTGNVYNNYFLGHLENNKINLSLEAGDVDAWVNENNFFGGRFSHSSSEGTNVAGARHILINQSAHPANNNVFYKPCVEGNTPEFHIECYGQYNTFIQPRFEATTPKVKYSQIDSSNYAHSNVILYGYKSEFVQITEDSNCIYNHVYTRNGFKVSGSGGTKGVFIASNTTSNNDPIFVGMPLGTVHGKDPSTAYLFAIGGNYSRYKRETDAYPRMEFDHANGVVSFGNGTSSPPFKLKAYGTGHGKIEGGNLYFDGGYNTSHIVLGNYHLWVDATGKLRIKNGVPTSDTDGTVVGTQS